MKLIVCPSCLVTVPLSRRLRHCQCKAVKGKYLDDGLHARVWGDPLVVGINSNDIVHHIREHIMEARGIGTIRGGGIEAWVITKDSDRVERL